MVITLSKPYQRHEDRQWRVTMMSRWPIVLLESSSLNQLVMALDPVYYTGYKNL